MPARGSSEEYESYDGLLSTGQFRVEEFRLPVLEGSVLPADKKPLVNVNAVPLRRADQLRGRRPAQQPAGARVGPGARQILAATADFEEYSFSPPRGKRGDC